ncbi:MAG: outer membrane beta-barrel protein [Colwellia sp.]|nr:outer membrane beta-barrel protein [Colwellia sp.]MCW8863390.1 outer membrane beta-barrel protein [Colwellia sp.]MCW9080007.1 outer membrane beta-barrel protein [Colwellia sp.]
MLFITRLLALLCLISLSLFAKQAYAAQESAFEITPLVGYRFGGDFEVNENDTVTDIKLTEEVSYGLLLAWDVDSKRQGEFLISHNNTEFSSLDNAIASNNNLSITYAHIGGNVPISKGVAPLFITGGLGLTHLSPEDSTLDNETRFSMNIGLATKIAVTENVNFRFGGRIYATLFNSDSHIFCDEAACAISLSSDLWIQSEINAGVTFTF